MISDPQIDSKLRRLKWTCGKIGNDGTDANRDVCETRQPAARRSRRVHAVDGYESDQHSPAGRFLGRETLCETGPARGLTSP